MEFSPETLNTFRILGTTLYGLFAGSVATSLLFPIDFNPGAHKKIENDRHRATAMVFHFAFGGAIVPLVVLVSCILAMLNFLYGFYLKISPKKLSKSGHTLP